MSTDSEKGALTGDQAPAEGDRSANAEANPAVAPPQAPAAEQKLADAEAEIARLRDQLLRTAADFDNFRKRARREQDDSFRRGREGFVKDLLPVFDNLERAIVHAEGSGPEVKGVADGLRMVLKQFIDTLDKLGVRRLNPVGQAFDPALHEAIQHMESADHPAGIVIAEVQPGYAMGDRLVRASMVVVSKGAPKPQAEA